MTRARVFGCLDDSSRGCSGCKVGEKYVPRYKFVFTLICKQMPRTKPMMPSTGQDDEASFANALESRRAFSTSERCPSENSCLPAMRPWPPLCRSRIRPVCTILPGTLRRRHEPLAREVGVKITGASAGIGTALARDWLRVETNLILTARRRRTASQALPASQPETPHPHNSCASLTWPDRRVPRDIHISRRPRIFRWTCS